MEGIAIWDGGLGIPGGIVAGVVTGVVVARRRGIPIRPLLDSTLPWAVRIDPANRPSFLEGVATFHPTFLYECLCNLVVVAVVLLVERRGLLRPVRLFAVYVCGYAVGRFVVERMRIDFADTIGGLRVNEWMSLIAFVAAGVFIVTGRGSLGSTDSATERPRSSSERGGRRLVWLP